MTDSDKLRRALEEHAERWAMQLYPKEQLGTKQADLAAVFRTMLVEGGAPYREMIVSLAESLNEIKSGAGRAEILGMDLARCPQCASAEVSRIALDKLKTELGMK
jgi:hypothetical protein